jgi:hypothetical protein
MGVKVRVPAQLQLLTRVNCTPNVRLPTWNTTLALLHRDEKRAQ